MNPSKTVVKLELNKIALDRMREGFEDKFGGIQVLYAPTGSG
jgi:CRISPR/Cas system-associated endonuclease/helicase Cas3